MRGWWQISQDVRRGRVRNLEGGDGKGEGDSSVLSSFNSLTGSGAGGVGRGGGEAGGATLSSYLSPAPILKHNEVCPK